MTPPPPPDKKRQQENRATEIRPPTIPPKVGLLSLDPLCVELGGLVGAAAPPLEVMVSDTACIESLEALRPILGPGMMVFTILVLDEGPETILERGGRFTTTN